MALVVKGLDGGFVTGCPGFTGSSWKASQTVSDSFLIFTAMCFWLALKGEVMNLVEVYNDECVEA